MQTQSRVWKKERNPSSERQKNDKNGRRERGGNKYGDATLRVYAFLETGLQKKKKKKVTQKIINLKQSAFLKTSYSLFVLSPSKNIYVGKKLWRLSHISKHLASNNEVRFWFQVSHPTK